MSRPIRWLALVLAAAQGCAAHPHAAAGGTSTRTRPDSIAAAAALTVLKEREWPRAYAEQDTALLQRLLAPSFRRVDADGTVSTRDDELAYVRSTRPSYDSLRFRITRLDVFANGTAIVAGVGTVHGARPVRSSPPVPRAGTAGDSVTTYASTNVLVLVEGRWRAVASHVSGVRRVPRPAP